MTSEEIVRLLDLNPHPEGGHYRETWRAAAAAGERASGTAIYYLLKRGETSHWHRVDAGEVWHFYAGAPLALSISADGVRSDVHVLGSNIVTGERPQIVVPAGHWQAARSQGDWTLVGCTVSPGFEFAGFEMAPAGWMPG
ncbi:cupin domain-containing protein [soil metagenome]